MSRCLQRCCLALATFALIWSLGVEPALAQDRGIDLKPIEIQTADGTFGATDVAAAQQFGANLGAAEWLGPMAPVALSPFFGVACLSGLALFGSEWFDIDNALIGKDSPLANETLFGVFLILTILTSLPRLTKVSKPFAQGFDQVETWAAFITLAVMKLVLDRAAGEGEVVAAAAQMPMLQLGVLSLPLDIALTLAGALNVFVINSVKFFFEVLVWLTPLPFLDAAFEAANKSAVAGLMALYAWNPVAATVVNLVVLGVCLLVFRWMHRRQVYFRKVLWDLIRRVFTKGKDEAPEKLTVFPKNEFEPFEDRARCRLQTTQKGWRLYRKRMFGERVVKELPREEYEFEIERGLFTHSVLLHELGGGGRRRPDPTVLSFGRGHDAALEDLARGLGATLLEKGERPERGAGTRKAEFA